MIRFNKLIVSLCLCIAITGVIGISSCKKDNSAPVEKPQIVDETAIEALLDKFYVPSDPSGDAALLQSYKDLSAAEFATFNKLREEKEQARLANENSGNKAADLSTLKLSWALRAEIDRLSVAKFGVHFNKLSNDQLHQIDDEAIANLRPVFAPSGETNAKTAAEEACPLYSYPYNTNTVSGAHVGRHGWSGVINSPGETLCDSEHKYNGWLVYIHGNDAASRGAINYYGNLGRRHPYFSDGYDTHVILGVAGMAIWVGLPGSFSANMR